MCCRQCGVCLHCTQIMRVTRAGEVCEISPQLSASARVCTVCLLSALMCPVQRKSALDFSQVLCFHLVFFWVLFME